MPSFLNRIAVGSTGTSRLHFLGKCCHACQQTACSPSKVLNNQQFLIMSHVIAIQGDKAAWSPCTLFQYLRERLKMSTNISSRKINNAPLAHLSCEFNYYFALSLSIFKSVLTGSCGTEILETVSDPELAH